MQCYETLNYVIFEKIVAKTQKDSVCFQKMLITTKKVQPFYLGMAI